MPIIKSAIKKVRQAKSHTVRNYSVRRNIKETIDTFKKSPKPDLFAKVMSVLDKAVKSNVIHKNKSARLKSRLSKLLPKVEKKVIAKKAPAKKASKKS